MCSIPIFEASNSVRYLKIILMPHCIGCLDERRLGLSSKCNNDKAPEAAHSSPPSLAPPIQSSCVSCLRKAIAYQFSVSYSLQIYCFVEVQAA